MAHLVKNLPATQETWVQSLGCGRSLGEVNGYPLQYSDLENSMDSSPWGRKESDMTEQLLLSQPRGRTLPFVYLFIHPFIYSKVFIKFLIFTRCCTRHQKCNEKQNKHES